jgi:hypothetical protein
MNGYGKLRRFIDKRTIIIELYLTVSAMGCRNGWWQAAWWPCSLNGSIGGCSATHFSVARGQRVRNRQPDGGFIADGSSPRTPASSLCCSRSGSASGIVSINPRV